MRTCKLSCLALYIRHTFLQLQNLAYFNLHHIYLLIIELASKFESHEDISIFRL